ncbi:addiction module protein [soil metagenome]
MAGFFCDMTTQLSEILQLSVAERIQLVEDIWDSISVVPDAVSLNEEQQAELERRLEAYQANPSEGISWNDLKNKLRGQA